MYRQIGVIAVISASLGLSGCNFMYKQNISHGNVISPYQASQIKPGMNITAVVQRLGAPLLKNIYPSNRLIYAYSLKPGHGDLQTKQVIVTFKNNRVVNVQRNV